MFSFCHDNGWEVSLRPRTLPHPAKVIVVQRDVFYLDASMSCKCTVDAKETSLFLFTDPSNTENSLGHCLSICHHIVYCQHLFLNEEAGKISEFVCVGSVGTMNDKKGIVESVRWTYLVFFKRKASICGSFPMAFSIRSMVSFSDSSAMQVDI